MTTLFQSEAFLRVLNSVGPKPNVNDQNVTRHYSETFSKELALLIGGLLKSDTRVGNVLQPEAKVPTCFGAKSLDVACLDQSDYLSLDISIKTFNFRDRKTKRYTHNFTGRFYELLGESLDIRLSYPEAVLAALVFLPLDSCGDGTRQAASSFGNAVKQFGKIAGADHDGSHALSYEYVFIGLHDDSGGLGFFDARTPPPKHGVPSTSELISTKRMLDTLLAKVAARSPTREASKPNVLPTFKWAMNREDN